MKIFGITLIWFVSLMNVLEAQTYCENKYDYIWLMGGIDLDTTEDRYGGSEINFNSIPPLINVHPKLIEMPHHNLSMSSKEGDLIFYSNGCSIMNSLNIEMENGDSLNPGEVYDWFCPHLGYNGFQSMLAIPSSYDSTLYYVLYISLVLPHDTNAFQPVQSENLYYALIDMSLNNGLGGVITKNEIILSDTSMIGTPLTATKHANGLDWWIITPDRWSNSFHTSFLGIEGIQYLGKRFIGIPPNPRSEGGQGKFSPDGSKFAWFHPHQGLYLYDFDRELGLLSNFHHIIIPVSDFIVGGCEFSPSGRFLYVNNDFDLYQIDTWSADLQESLTHIATYDGFGDPLPTRFFYMERTPDNRIIMNVVNGSKFLHVIQEPNLNGKACRFEQHALKLPTVNNFTLPHFPNYRLGAVEDSICDEFLVQTKDILESTTPRYTIYPNPARDFIQIIPLEVGLGNDFTVSIWDFYGRKIMASEENVIYLNNILPGIYFCSIIDGDKFNQTTKLIILD